MNFLKITFSSFKLNMKEYKTTISVTKETISKLRECAIHPRETNESIIERLIKDVFN